jgi:hypothetical protein
MALEMARSKVPCSPPAEAFLFSLSFSAPTPWRGAMGTSCTGHQACAFGGGAEGGTNAEDYHT